MLEFAVLGILHDSPMHGYQLRKRLRELLGWMRAISFGSLYPTLRRLQRAGLISEDLSADTAWDGTRGRQRRARKVYRLTAAGKQRFAELAADSGPAACDDESFGVHLVFFARTPASARMRILEGRRRRVEERREGLRCALARPGEGIDHYTRALQQQGLEASEHEVRWLNELIAHERAEQGFESK